MSNSVRGIRDSSTPGFCNNELSDLEMMGVGGRVESWLNPGEVGPGVVALGERSDSGDLSDSLSVDSVLECDRLE